MMNLSEVLFLTALAVYVIVCIVVVLWSIPAVKQMSEEFRNQRKNF